MKKILQGSQSGYAGKVTIGKLYEHFDGCFHDDEGAIRSTGPHAWKAVPAAYKYEQPHNQVLPEASSGTEMPPCKEPGLTEQEQVDLDEIAYQESCAATSEPTITRKEIIAKSEAFGTQEDGSHYTEMQLQPLEATYLRYGIEGLKAAIHTKVDKYISRKKDDEVIQLKKAHHCLAILIEITELEHAYS